jgi:hypothetical protein
MGIAMWAGSGVIAFFVARNVPAVRTPKRLLELTIAIVVALLFGMTATALDFGGWRELDWRAAAFCFFGAMAAVAVTRLVRIAAARR